MQTDTPPRARAEASEPLFTPLGVQQHRNETWYYLRVGNVVRSFRPSQTLGLAFLLALYPNHDHWVRLYPSDTYGGRKVNWPRACAAIQRMCIAAGEYRPEPVADDGTS